MQELRRSKEGVEEEGGGEKYENGDPTRRSESSKGYPRICGKNTKI